MPSPFELKTFADDKALATAAASDWVELLKLSRSQYTVALSGGRVVKAFFAEVAKLAASAPGLMANVHFFWADERCVTPTDADSNFRLANENLFAPLGIPAGTVHRLKGELPAAEAVEDAISELNRILPRADAGIPALDMIFLGMGEDGHTASLMPNAKPEVLNCTQPFTQVDNSPKPPPDRLTMTYPMLAAAENVWALIPSKGKEAALKQTLSPNGKTPLARVLQSRSKTIIYTDLNETQPALSI
jgi:6-phosphogluconolactonase